MHRIKGMIPLKLKQKIARIVYGKGEFSISSDELRKEWVINELKMIPEGSVLLDAGAGECKYKPYCKHIKYVSQDFCEYKGKEGGNDYGLHVNKWDTSTIDIVSDITAIPVGDKTFDYVLCSEVFEHIAYPDEALNEFRRILKDNGVLILTAPFSSMTHFAPYHFHTGFNVYWYEKHLADYGFCIEKIEKNGDYYSCLADMLETAQNYEENDRFLNKWLIRRLIPIFRRYAKTPNNHNDVMCTGIYVVARKVVSN